MIYFIFHVRNEKYTKFQENPCLTDPTLDQWDQRKSVQSPNTWNHDSGTSLEMVELQYSKTPSTRSSNTIKGASPFKPNNQAEEKKITDSGTICTLTSLNNDVSAIKSTSSTKISNVSTAVSNSTKQKCFQQLDGEAVKPAATIPCCDKSQTNITVVDKETCNENLTLTPTAVASLSIPTHSTNSASLVTTISTSAGKTYDLLKI